MPVKIQPDGAILRLSFHGKCTKADINDLAVEMNRLEADLKHIPDRLTDTTGIDERETDFEVLFPVAEKRRTQVFPNNFRSAIVAPTAVAYGLARIFQSINTNPQIEIQIFKTLAEAEAWLGVKKGAQ